MHQPRLLLESSVDLLETRLGLDLILPGCHGQPSQCEGVFGSFYPASEACTTSYSTGVESHASRLDSPALTKSS
jgi:hypothetical protein